MTQKMGNTGRHTMAMPTIRILIGLISMVMVADLSQSTNAQEAVPLKGYDYPWYDAETDRLKPIELTEESKPRTLKRNDVPIDNTASKTPAPPATNGTNATTNTPTGSGWLTADMMFQLFAALGLIVIFVVLAFLLYNFLQVESGTDNAASARKRKLLSESIEQLPFELQTGNGDFRSMAHQAYSAGDLRRAMIFLYSHVLITLDQNELILLRKGKTNRQYLKEVLHYPEVSGYFKNVMLPFESVFFGDHDLERARFEECWSQLDYFHANVQQKTGGVV